MRTRPFLKIGMKEFVLCLVALFFLRGEIALSDTLDFRVNDDGVGNEQNYPSIAVNGEGRTIIIWQDYRSNSNYDIYGQLFTSSGTRIGKNFKVNDDLVLSDQFHPDVAMDGQGNFLVVWEDRRNTAQGDLFDIYAQLYDSLHNKVGSNFKVNQDMDTISQHDPSVAADGHGRYLVSWTDYRDGNWNIYAQRVGSSGQFIEDNFKVNDGTDTAYQHSSCVGMNYYGNFVITWYDKRNGNDDIYAQLFDSSATKIGANFKANQDQTTTSQTYPQADIDNQGNFLIAWCDTRNGNEDIYAQRFDESGSPVDSNFKVNTDASSSNQRNPSVAMNGWGDLVIAWQDYRDGNYNVYAQKYDSWGNSSGGNFKVNSDTLQAKQAYPEVATNGDFIYFAWVDERILSNGLDIYARFLPWLINTFGRIVLSSGSHNFRDVNIGETDDWTFWIHNTGTQNLTVDSIASSDAAFTITTPSFPQTITRRDSLSSTSRFSPSAGHFYQGSLSIHNSDPDNAVVTVSLSGWGYPHEDRPDSFSLISPSRGARIDTLPLSLIWQKSHPADPSDSIKYTLWYGTDSSFQEKTEVSDIADTHYVISDSLTEDTVCYWKVKATDGFGLYIWSNQTDWYWLVNLDNQPPGNFDLIFPGDQDTVYNLLPIFIWHRSNDSDIRDSIDYVLYYDTLSNFLTTQIIPNIADTFYTLTDSLEESEVYHWKVEAKDIAGLGTFCDSTWSFVTPEGTGVDQDKDWHMADHPMLLQNCPNPFNAETKIKYFLNEVSTAEITIYNLLGQKVRKFDSYQFAGWNELIWDGKDKKGCPVNSGIYFYQLKTQRFRSIRKMILMK